MLSLQSTRSLTSHHLRQLWEALHTGDVNVNAKQQKRVAGKKVGGKKTPLTKRRKYPNAWKEEWELSLGTAAQMSLAVNQGFPATPQALTVTLPVKRHREIKSHASILCISRAEQQISSNPFYFSIILYVKYWLVLIQKKKKNQITSSLMHHQKKFRSAPRITVAHEPAFCLLSR